MSPGDVLLLPAHWLHYVIALDLSFSVNLWVNSREETTVSQLLAPPHPWPDGLPVASEQLYVLCWKIDVEDQRRNLEMSGYEWWLWQDYWLGNAVQPTPRNPRD